MKNAMHRNSINNQSLLIGSKKIFVKVESHFKSNENNREFVCLDVCIYGKIDNETLKEIFQQKVVNLY